MAEQEPLVDPIYEYTISETGFITVYGKGETGATSRAIFHTSAGLEAAGLGYLDAAHALDLFNEDPAEGWDYVNDGAKHTELTDDDVDKLLEGG